MEDRAFYAAFKSKDVRFDGRFFVGVSSTGIYCRPVCTARLPKMENCTFFSTAAAAERAGYRPCLLCRPERAPGTAPVDAARTLARRAAALIEEDLSGGVGALAGRLGCTDRHLRRAFSAEYGVSPIEYAQTCRLLLAKGLLTDTDLSVIDVAMASGFGSLRRFNDLFKRRYRLAPTALRKHAAGAPEGGVTLALGYRPPYPWGRVLGFLALRAIPGVEVVRGGEYLRAARVMVGDRAVSGWVRVGHRPQANVLTVSVSEALLPVLAQVLARVRHLFDLTCDPDAVTEVLLPMNGIRPGLCVPGARVPGCFDAFEMAARAVLGQQISVKAARTLAGRLVAAHGMPVGTGIEGLTHAFPPPEEIAGMGDAIFENLGKLGVVRARSSAIRALAQAILSREVDLSVAARPEEELKKLIALPGIGLWTAQYVAMRTMGWTDAFLSTDVGVKKALAPRTPAEMLALSDSWRPFRSYAVINLWNSL